MKYKSVYLCTSTDGKQVVLKQKSHVARYYNIPYEIIKWKFKESDEIQAMGMTSKRINLLLTFKPNTL